MKHWRMFVDGKWVEATGGACYALPNPATEEAIAMAPDASREDLAVAIAAARRAFDSGPWPRSTYADRARWLHRLADGLLRRKDEFRALLVAAHGAERLSHALQLDTPIAQLRNYAELTRTFRADEDLPQAPGPSGAPVRSLAHRQPAGACGLLPAWNLPLYTTLAKLGPALAMGCTVVVKPSPLGPLVDLLLAECIEACELPPGVVNVVTGQSDALGAELAASPALDMLSFTGSVATGRRVMEAASGTVKRVQLELGGSSALIVLDDYALDAAASIAAAPAYAFAGQSCAQMARVLVSRRRLDRLAAMMAAFLRGVRVGNPADPNVSCGPLIRPERRDAVERAVEAARAAGGAIVCGGQRPLSLAKGWFFEPTILTRVPRSAAIAREEVLGPVVTVTPYEDEDDAIRLANDSDYGLVAGILSSDKPRAIALARRLRTGAVSINGALNPLHAPFGGFKQSGLGREGGMYGLREFTEVQSIAWPA